MSQAQIAPGVFHHLQNTQAEFLHGDAVYLSHLFGSYGRHCYAILDAEYHRCRHVKSLL